MAANHPESVEGVVLRDIAEVVGAAEEKNGPWPQLDEPRFTRTQERFSSPERVTLWTMVVLLGAVTIYAIATGDQRVLLAVLTIAAGTLLRLTRLKPERRTPKKRAYDPGTKRRAKKGTNPQ
jgi:pimeloyl-ACP methyl ester carboxylesterase